MQTRDAVKGLHNFREFEKVPFCFHKIFLKNTREFKTSQPYFTHSHLNTPTVSSNKSARSHDLQVVLRNDIH